MKFAVLAMVKNESDIIESFVRHNLQFADEMFILDNGSTDNTALILENLKNEGLPIHISYDATEGYQQQTLSSRLLNNTQTTTDADIFMFLDADEFICIHPNSEVYPHPEQYQSFFQTQLETVKRDGVCSIKWLNFLPLEVNNDNNFINHFYEFSECDNTLTIHQKVIYSRSMLDIISLTQGNHLVIDKLSDKPISQTLLTSIALAHFPIRSSEQAMAKILSTAISINSRTINEGESFHIFNMCGKIINNNYTLSINDCRELAKYYGIPSHYRGGNKLGTGKINPQPLAHKYLQLSNLNSLHSIHLLAEDFAKKNKHLIAELRTEYEKNSPHQDYITKLSNHNNELSSQNHLLNNQLSKLSETNNTLNNQNHLLNNQLDQSVRHHHKYKKLLVVQLLKPLIKFEQLLHSLNHYRKGFRRLMRDTGSFGKAYQTTRRYYRAYGLKSTKQYLKNYSHLNLDLNGEITILTTRHTYYIAKLIENCLNNIGVATEIIFNRPQDGYSDNWHIVICAQIFDELPKHYLAFQMEQSVSSRWFTHDYFQKLKQAKFVFDYSITNIDFLLKHDIPFSKLFYLPIAMLPNDDKHTPTYEYDVAFYGDPNCERRKQYLERLQEKFSVKVISEVFGDDLHALLRQAKVIVNIHYYEGALLETTRLYECLSLGKVIVSEAATDQSEHSALEDLVDFTAIDDIDAMIERVAYWLNHDKAFESRLQAIQVAGQQTSAFEFYFYRFLLSQDLIDFERFYQLSAKYVQPQGGFWCLNLPESTLRRQDFINDNHYGIELLAGLRHHIGWVGCGLSYKFMMRLAEDLKLPQVTICEDDVEFYPNFSERYHSILQDLKSDSHWDVFSGLIADLSPEAEIGYAAISSDKEHYYRINKLVSTVFNVYHHSAYKKIYDWDYHVRGTHNTIDRYIESHGGINGLIVSPFLVGHKEELHSTLWGISNTQYADMIANSQKLLDNKISELEKSVEIN